MDNDIVIPEVYMCQFRYQCSSVAIDVAYGGKDTRYTGKHFCQKHFTMVSKGEANPKAMIKYSQSVEAFLRNTIA